MGKVQDILLDSFNDLIIENGDIKVGDSTEQHQTCLLLAAKGDYKQSPLVGVDIFHWLNDERPEDMMREIRIQFTNDGMRINKMEVDLPSKLTIDAPYK
ncbi:MAG: hypothetical protein IPG85_09730 [Bacteroidetes bacterium]|nr:hypothetical protein [Bacteroidota bacterium]